MNDRSDIAIEFDHVDYSVNGTRALISDLNLAIRSHEILILLGRSGSGKSTTLKLMNRLLSPTPGRSTREGSPSTACLVVFAPSNGQHWRKRLHPISDSKPHLGKVI